MAIALEQERKPVNVLGILIALVVVGSLFAGAYFLFFKRPELVDVVVPSSIQNVRQISTIPFAPERIFTAEKFRALRQYGTEIVLPQAGKSNPFLP